MDSYVETLLTDMVKNLSELVIVVNGELTAKSYAKLTAFTDNIILRENKGLDAWAYKTAMESYGWDGSSSSTRSSCSTPPSWGPVYPFEEMFHRDGRPRHRLLGHHLVPPGPRRPFGMPWRGTCPVHLQSHFHAYRRSMVSSKAFQDYWATFLRSIHTRIP